MLSLEASSMDIKSSFTEIKLGDLLQLINNCLCDPKPMTIEAKSFHGLEGSSVPTPVMGIAECFLTFPVSCFLHYELVWEYRVSPEASGDRLEEKEIELIGLSVTKISNNMLPRTQGWIDEVCILGWISWGYLHLYISSFKLFSIYLNIGTCLMYRLWIWWGV